MATEEGDFSAWLAATTAATENRLRELLAADRAAPRLAAAMRDATLGGGKRLRPAMVFATAGDGRSAAAVAAACAVELIHCYSLAHDDLPCMDDDDSRRGRPSCHRAHGEAMALLAGDCLQSLAFETLATADLPAAACGMLARAIGAEGMGGGQALDIDGAEDGAEAIARMHRLKTGALFACAARLGLLCRGDASADDAAAVAAFADEFGLMYQLTNDVHDVERDRRAGKTTYATARPAEARRRAAEAGREAIAALGGRFSRLADIARTVCPT